MWKGALLLVGALVLGLLASACARTGTYPLDIYYEMHYSEAYRAGEPARWDVPAEAVPRQGKKPVAVTIPFDQAEGLRPTIPNTPENRRWGRELFAINCAPCHGVYGDGQSLAADRITDATTIRPPAMASDRVRGRADGQIYHTISNGRGLMPAMGKLLSEDERWAIVFCVRAMAQTGLPPAQACP
ncbi:MAG: cytochrome c [Dehalococcoidia bacterium]|nr:cytochrome c [Dehalococcoidia bacterium]MDW8119986.1 cytochrome c [Chloroflexota bacterium]